MSLSVVINTKDSAQTLARTLKSVEFADEIVVVDMESSDDTVKIAKKFTKKVFSHKDVGYVEPARNFALGKATGDWILVVDSDEEVPASLKRLIKEILKLDKAGKLSADCFYLPRKNIIFGRWIKKTGWWPDHVLRFFRKGHVEWSDEIHSVPITKGEVRELPAQEKLALVHHNYQTIEQYVERLNRYSTIQAEEKLAQKQRDTNAAGYFQAFSREFLTRLFAHQGIDDGSHGLNLSLLQSFSEAVMMMKIWEKQSFKDTRGDQTKLIIALNQFQKELSYWIADWQVGRTRGIKQLYWRIRRKLQV